MYWRRKIIDIDSRLEEIRSGGVGIVLVLYSCVHNDCCVVVNEWVQD